MVVMPNEWSNPVQNKQQITAIEMAEKPMLLRTADRLREWMDETADRFAYRCLPVAIANQVECMFASGKKLSVERELSGLCLH